jgi:hypothetical protein
LDAAQKEIQKHLDSAIVEMELVKQKFSAAVSGVAEDEDEDDDNGSDGTSDI